ncbi:hypothetical protein [Chitinophaga sp. HK235]|uniref:hypothetical protein n=1 Tax=Chitinophaga sp. HK235 TaxID=2952571 RepID=UPI001BAD5C17|nr:hypothetical protein [Chitinophaga sp. HK235]
MQRFILLLHVIILYSQLPLKAQQTEKGYFNPKDSGNCYLAIPPLSGKIKGTLVLFAGFTGMLWVSTSWILPALHSPALAFRAI